jgi:hypothetical protein
MLKTADDAAYLAKLQDDDARGRSLPAYGPLEAVLGNEFTLKTLAVEDGQAVLQCCSRPIPLIPSCAPAIACRSSGAWSV